MRSPQRFSLGAGSAAAQAIATLEATAGQVTVLRLGQPQATAPSMPLQLNDILVTRQGRASVRFLSDGTVLRVGPESRVQIDESASERDIKLFFGRIWAHVIRWKERPTRFSSGSTIAAIRGTELSLAVESDGNETQLSVLEGHVEASTDAGKLNLEGGQVATGAKGRAPAVTLRAKPLDAVQWALYYPPVLKSGAPDSLTQRAAAKLAAGSVEDAGKDIAEALKANPNDADALALQTIISVATNRPDAALASAQKAVAADPKSATAQVALSYAQQAKFDLEAARASLEKAVQLDPTDALAWARLAEIRSSLGQGSASLEAAQKATALEPNLARTQTVLGFSHLTQVHTGEATAAFRKAIELDSSDPLPRLGPRPRPHSRRRPGRGQQGARDRRQPRPRPGPRPQLPGQGLLRAEARRPGRPRVRRREEGGPERPDPVSLRRDQQADDQPTRRGARERQQGDRAERQPGGLPLAAAARRRPRRAQREPRPHLHRPRLPGPGPRRGLEIGQHRPEQLLGPPAARRQLRRPAAPRDRPRERALPVADAAAAQHDPDPAEPRREQPVPDQLAGPRAPSRSTSSTRSSTATR